MTTSQVRALLETMDEEQRREVLSILRQEYSLTVHPIETAWGTSAEVILEAISEASDLTQRGVRGVLAEAIFRRQVVPSALTRWTPLPVVGDQSFDLLLDDGQGPISIQVKNQRRERGAPKIHQRLTVKEGRPVYVVETQRTRTGNKRSSKRPSDGRSDKPEATRPYRFGEFDLLAVCLQPSTGSWTDFIYCPAHLLVPRASDPALLDVLQPVYLNSSERWTFDFEAAVAAVRQYKQNGN